MKYVYLLRAGKDHYKVGVATSVTKRVGSIQTSNPTPIEIVSTVIVDDAYKLEGELHSKLSSFRTDGGTEWFQLYPEQAIEIAVLMHKVPEIDVSNRVTINNQLVEQRLRHKSLEKKLDMLVGMHKKPRYLQQVDSHKEEKDEPADNEKTTAKPDKPLPVQKQVTTDDEYMLQALDVFREKGKASTSLLQRSLSIGYGKAARIMDRLEKAGYISELDGANARELINDMEHISEENEENDVKSSHISE